MGRRQTDNRSGRPVTGRSQAASGTAKLIISSASHAPAITSASHTTLAAGQVGSFEISATGQPTLSLTASGRLPAGITFEDYGNGTATLSGTPAAETGGVYPLTITAHNGVSPDATQAFVLTVRGSERGPAGVLITRLRATPLGPGCVSETGTHRPPVPVVTGRSH